MTGVGAKWVVQRFEPSAFDDYGGDRMSMSPIGSPKVCEDWREACEVVERAIGRTTLKYGVEAKSPCTVFQRDGAVIVIYMELRLD